MKLGRPIKGKTTKSAALITLTHGHGPATKFVTIGIDVTTGAATRRNYFEWSKDGQKMVMETRTGRRKVGKFTVAFLSAMLPCLHAVEYFRKFYPKKFDYTFSELRFRNFTKITQTAQIGTRYAAFCAAAIATGFWPEWHQERLTRSGWSLCKGR